MIAQVACEVAEIATDLPLLLSGWKIKGRVSP
jgi:hypothetical protein